MNTSKVGGELPKAVASSAPGECAGRHAPPFVYFDAVGASLASSRVYWGRRMSIREERRLHREISVENAQGSERGVLLDRYSERRQLLKESSEIVARKAAAVYAGG